MDRPLASPSFGSPGHCAERGTGQESKEQAPGFLYGSVRTRSLWEISDSRGPGPGAGCPSTRGRWQQGQEGRRQEQWLQQEEQGLPEPRKKAPREGAEKATGMGKVGTSLELEDRPDVLEAQRRHIPTSEEAEGPGAQDRAWHPLCPSAQARRDPTPRVWADARHPIL